MQVFVYGTLMRGEAAHFRLESAAHRVGPGWTTGHLVYLDAGYPALLPGPARRVYGELYVLNRPEVLDELDVYEGFDPENPAESLFVREIRDVTLTPGGRARAWCYVMRPSRHGPAAAGEASLEGAVPVPGGRWVGNVYGR